MNGTGDWVNTTGAGDAIWIGGDGQFASNANDDIVSFSRSGLLQVYNYSRIDATGNGVSATLGANDSFGLTGSGDAVNMSANDTVTATGSNNIYVFGSGDGQDVIAAGSGANTGTVDFGSGLTDENLWFQKSGNNLQIDVMGTNNALTIDDWFGGANAAAVQSFMANGLTLDSQVGQLMSAMAAYSVGHSGFDPTAVSQSPNDSTLQSAIAAAWHH